MRSVSGATFPVTNSVVHDPDKPHVTVGFHGAYTGQDIEGYRDHYRNAMTQSGITDVQLSMFLVASQLYLTPNETVVAIDKYFDRFNDTLYRSNITRDQLSALLTDSGLNLAPAMYAEPSRPAIETMAEAGAFVPFTAQVSPELSEEVDVTMTEADDADMEDGKKSTREKVRFSDQ